MDPVLIEIREGVGNILGGGGGGVLEKNNK